MARTLPPSAAAALEDYLAAIELEQTATPEEALYTDSESQFLVQAFWHLRGQELAHHSKQELAQMLLEAQAQLKAIMLTKPLAREAFYRASLEEGALILARDAQRKDES